MSKHYIRLNDAIVPYDAIETKVGSDGVMYLLDGRHLVDRKCVISEGDEITLLLDKVVTVGTHMGEPLEPRTASPGMLDQLIADRKAGKYTLPFRIYGAIWRKGAKGNPILTTVCEFPHDDATPELF